MAALFGYCRTTHKKDAVAILSLSLCLCIGMVFDFLRSVHPLSEEIRYIRDSNRRLKATEGKRRENCQIVYITGVEGSSHHGVLPIIKALAKQQDPETGLGYHVDIILVLSRVDSRRK